MAKLQTGYRSNFFTRTKNNLVRIYPATTTRIRRRPFLSFLTVLGLLLGVMVLSNILTPQKKETQKSENIKEVRVYKIGAAPKMQFQGQIEKSGVVKISSLAGGVVQEVNVVEGQQVGKGANLITVASNYQGDNIPALQSAIASKQFELAKQNLEINKDIISKQRSIAAESDANTSELRDIASKSLDDTKSLINQNNEIISTLNQNLSQFEATNSGDINRNFILQTRQMRLQFQAAVAQLSSQQRNLELQTDTNKPPTKLSDLQKQITLRQLDLQEKSLELSKELASLQLAIAVAGQNAMHPVSPFSGIIQRIYVHPGHLLSPGAPILSIAGVNQHVEVIVKLPASLAQQVSQFEESNLNIGGQIISLVPEFISTEATDGSLNSVIYDLGEEFSKGLTDGEFILVEAPIGLPDTSSAVPFVPIDAVFQTEDEAYLFVYDNGRAMSRKVELGDVQGEFVQIKSGLRRADQVILNRNVIEGDKLKVVN